MSDNATRSLQQGDIVSYVNPDVLRLIWNGIERVRVIRNLKNGTVLFTEENTDNNSIFERQCWPRHLFSTRIKAIREAENILMDASSYQLARIKLGEALEKFRMYESARERLFADSVREELTQKSRADNKSPREIHHERARAHDTASQEIT